MIVYVYDREGGVVQTKRVVDRMLSCVLLILLSPLLIMVAIAIKLTSPGPVIYGGMRVGLRGNEFYIHKFRTLRENSATSGLDVVVSGDTRITALGKILRMWYLDEFSQLWDVLLGRMSLVGPRPYTRPDADHRASLFHGFNRREVVRPGMTGLAQVLLRRGRSERNLRRALVCDRYYIRHRSLWLDFQLLMRTIVVICEHRGA